MEKVSAKVKPVPLQHQLDLYDRMASRMKKSLDRTKKRLHNAELTLNLQPPADEPAEIKKWNDKIEELVYRRINLPFPTYYEVKKEADVKKFREAQQNPKKKKSSTISVQVNKFTPEEIVHSKKNAFGGPKAGEVLGKIENYKGGNTSFTSTRTLVRRESVNKRVTDSSLPEWFGPQYYEGSDSKFLTKPKEKYYQLPFRGSRSESDVNRHEIREHILILKSNIADLREISTPGLERLPSYMKIRKSLSKSQELGRSDSFIESNNSPNSQCLSPESKKSANSRTYNLLGRLNTTSGTTNFDDDGSAFSFDSSILQKASLQSVEGRKTRHLNDSALKILKSDKPSKSSYKVKDYTLNGLANQYNGDIYEFDYVVDTVGVLDRRTPTPGKMKAISRSVTSPLLMSTKQSPGSSGTNTPTKGVKPLTPLESFGRPASRSQLAASGRPISQQNSIRRVAAISKKENNRKFTMKPEMTMKPWREKPKTMKRYNYPPVLNVDLKDPHVSIHSAIKKWEKENDISQSFAEQHKKSIAEIVSERQPVKQVNLTELLLPDNPFIPVTETDYAMLEALGTINLKETDNISSLAKLSLSQNVN